MNVQIDFTFIANKSHVVTKCYIFICFIDDIHRLDSLNGIPDPNISCLKILAGNDKTPLYQNV